MAQSPESASDTIRESYTRGWDALGALIAQGKSFSGRERNCAFINTGAAAPSFACGSGALNLDQMDDSRALIPVDWDGDGVIGTDCDPRDPERFPGAILIAQHMPDKFTRTFAERLDKKGSVRVVEAQDGDPVVARRAYVCPGKMCMEVTGGLSAAGGAFSELRLRVVAPAAGDRYVPSADRLLKSAAQAGGSRALGVILTGMGDDGVAGAKAIRAAGGSVIGESEDTAVVYGMPGAAFRAGVLNESLPLPALADYLAALT